MDYNSVIWCDHIKYKAREKHNELVKDLEAAKEKGFEFYWVDVEIDHQVALRIDLISSVEPNMC